MTLRQRILKVFYPVLLAVTKAFRKNTVVLQNEYGAMPPASFYDLSIPLSNGASQPLAQHKGKKVLIVNTASNCGYTAQYGELQQLQERHKDLVVIAFPSNDFKEQEKGTDSEIAAFCSVYNVGFPLASKSSVLKKPQQNPVYQWLTDKEKNGWNTKQPSWNFSKYLVNEDGVLTHYFDPSISPLSAEVEKAIDQ
jgi:glutathione peroxidase